MRHTRLWVVATIIACCILAGFILFAPHTHVLAPAVESLTPQPMTPSVALHDVYKKGQHTISGAIEAPDACTTVSADATLLGDASTTQSILITISMPEDTGICLQQQTIVNFSTTLSAPASLPITATVNGHVASTTAL